MELEAENWRLRSTTLVRGVSGKLEDENWRLCSITLVRGAICGANWRLCSTTLVRGVSGELEDDWQYNFSTRSNLGSWKLRTGDLVVQL